MLIDDSELLYGDVSYERRIVYYFDVLGWRNEIESSGTDTKRIARLAAFTRLFQAAIAAAPDRISGAQITTFSDNVIMSIPYNLGYLEWWTRIVAGNQLALGLMGFWIRGAITVGDLFHDSNAVFGPALNRAHELESKSAIYPRVLLDPLAPELNELKLTFVSQDESWQFLDPFTADFVEATCATPVDENVMKQFNLLVGSEIAAPDVRRSGKQLLAIIYVRLSRELQIVVSPKVREKYMWLLKRIAPRIDRFGLAPLKNQLMR